VSKNQAWVARPSQAGRVTGAVGVRVMWREVSISIVNSEW